MGSFLPLIFTTKVVQTIHTDHVHHHSRTGPEAESDVAEARFLLQRRWLNYWQFFWIVLYSLFTFPLTAHIFSHYAYYLPSETRDKSSNHLPCDLNCPGGCKHAAFSCSGKNISSILVSSFFHPPHPQSRVCPVPTYSPTSACPDLNSFLNGSMLWENAKSAAVVCFDVHIFWHFTSSLRYPSPHTLSVPTEPNLLTISNPRAIRNYLPCEGVKWYG